MKNGSNQIYVIYESPHRIIQSLETINKELNSAILLVCSDLTKIHEKSIYGPISEVINQLRMNEKSNLGEYTIVINKNEIYKKVEHTQSLESMLIDQMVKNNCSLKEAIHLLNKESRYSKKDLYNASLHIKQIIISRE